MPNAPQRLMDYLNQDVGYHHPRTGKEHSDQFSLFILDDLLASQDKVGGDLRDGVLAFELNVEVSTNVSSHIIDLVIGKPKFPAPSIKGPLRTELDPTQYRIVMDHKSVVTAHRNNKNRLRDMKEFAEHVFRSKTPQAVVAGTMLVGTALTYLSVENLDRILRARGQENKSLHWRQKMCKNDRSIVKAFQGTDAITTNRPMDPHNTFSLYVNEIPRRNDPAQPGFDAFSLIPVHIDNIGPCRLDTTTFPDRHDLFTYTRFIEDIAAAYRLRF